MNFVIQCDKFGPRAPFVLCGQCQGRFQAWICEGGRQDVEWQKFKGEVALISFRSIFYGQCECVECGI